MRDLKQSPDAVAFEHAVMIMWCEAAFDQAKKQLSDDVDPLDHFSAGWRDFGPLTPEDVQAYIQRDEAIVDLASPDL